MILYDRFHAWADYDSSGNLIANYLFGEEVDEILASNSPSSGLACHLPDRQGTIYDLINGSGALTSSTQYSAFGVPSSPTSGDRFKYTGREHDSETGLYYYRARYYDPEIGRFISEDPLGLDSGDDNFYRYVGNSPGNGTDPSGMLSTLIL